MQITRSSIDTTTGLGDWFTGEHGHGAAANRLMIPRRRAVARVR